VYQRSKELWETHKDSASLKTALTTSSENDSVLCPAHTCSINTGQGFSNINLDSFADHAHLICSLDFSDNMLRSLPSGFCNNFPSLTLLNISENHLAYLPDDFVGEQNTLQVLILDHNQMQTLPPAIGKCGSLTFLNLSFNKLASLPDEFAGAMKSLQVLNLSGNPLFRLPACVVSSTELQELYASQTGIEELPDAFPQHSELTKLHLNNNAISRLPASFANLTHLVDLDLTGLKWIESQDAKASVTSSAFSAFLDANPLLKRIDKKVCDHNSCLQFCKSLVLLLGHFIGDDEF